jgi:quercetin dioxygenase-like cupin family protein
MADPDNAPIPADNFARQLTVADPDSAATHVAVAGDVYTILVSGEQTVGRYCLIDMIVPPGGGPPPHRHDFEEMFAILEGELEFTFRSKVTKVGPGSTVNIPANAPHAFRNESDAPAHLLCMGAPVGLDEFFLLVGDRVPSRGSAPPNLNQAQREERIKRAKEFAPKFRTELLIP